MNIVTTESIAFQDRGEVLKAHKFSHLIVLGDEY